MRSSRVSVVYVVRIIRGIVKLGLGWQTEPMKSRQSPYLRTPFSARNHQSHRLALLIGSA